jgi:NTE family protein
MKYKLGVSLSGGGYRAAAFHLGTLRYLNRVGILKDVDCLSTVSGGSIIGAAYCSYLNHSDSFQDFETFLRERLGKSIIKKVLLSFPFIRLVMLVTMTLAVVIYFNSFTTAPWVALVIIVMAVILFVKFQFRLFPVSQIIENEYNKMFYKEALLSELPEKPLLIINATNLQTGRLFYFTKNNISDSTYDNTYEQGGTKRIFKHEKFTLSKAVMSSSCVPSFFTPIVIGSELLVSPKESQSVKPVLIDGGVYDNQGIHKLTHPGGQFECNTVIVSDAGNLLPLTDAYKNNVLTLLMRTVEVFMTRIKNFQMMANLYQNRTSGKEIAYITLGWDMSDLARGFVRNLKDGNLPNSVKEDHGFTEEFLRKKTDDELLLYISNKIGIEDIKARMPTTNQIKIARLVATNLTALSVEEIDSLSLYAEIMTEVQVKLYCPSIKIL